MLKRFGIYEKKIMLISLVEKLWWTVNTRTQN